jgi:hypothetical protein
MLNVVNMNVANKPFMPSVIVLNVVMLSIVAPKTELRESETEQGTL